MIQLHTIIPAIIHYYDIFFRRPVMTQIWDTLSIFFNTVCICITFYAQRARVTTASHALHNGAVAAAMADN